MSAHRRTAWVRLWLGVVIAMVVLDGGTGEAQRHAPCACAATPPIPRCDAGLVSSSFDDVVARAPQLDGTPVAVRAVLHRFFGCSYRTTTEGCFPSCGGQVALVRRASDDDRVVYLGTAETTGPFGCTGDETCPCCAVDARDQVVIARGTLRATPTIRIESPTLCVP